jgi:hypothetical protein
MSGLFLKAATIVVLTHGMRLIGRQAGPRWGGLVLGLPCSTALALVFLGRERGVEFAVRSAESGLLGLVGAVAAAWVFAWALGRGVRLAPSLGLAVVGYFAVAWAMSAEHIADGGLAAAVVVSTLGVLAASVAVTRLGLPEGGDSSVAPSTTAVRTAAIRTVVPVAFLLATTGAAGLLGQRWAGLLSTFPAMFLAVLVVTYCEGGAAVATRTAQAFPRGNFCMIAFIAVFRLACPEFGLAPGTTLAYVSALAALLAIQVIETLLARADRSRLAVEG